MKKTILTIFAVSFVASGIFAQAKSTIKFTPTVFKLLQKPSYRQLMAKIEARAGGEDKQSVKNPYLIYTQLWDTGSKNWATDTFEKYTIAWDVNKNLQSITDESWDSVNNGAVVKSVESSFVKINEPVSVDNNVTVNYFPANIVNQELQNGTWVNAEKELVTFDANNRITSVLAQQWSNNAWADYIRYDISYDTKGNFTGLFLNINSGGTWTLYQGIKETFTFDNNGFTTGMLQSTSTGGGAYINSANELFQVDSKGVITNAVVYTYDTLAGQLEKYDSLYNMSWLYFNPILSIDYETLGTKGILGVGGDKYLGYTEMQYDPSNSQWGTPQNNIYTYNADSLTTNVITQNWQNNAWINNTSDSTSYYTGGDIKTYLTRYWSGAWLNTSLGNNNINTYDADDDITECIAQNSDPSNGKVFDNYSKTEYLYTHTSGIEQAFHSAFKVYPNPVSNNLNIDLGQTVSSRILTITDVTGKTVQISKGNINHVDVTGLPTGMYFISVNDGTEVFTGKFIKE